MRDNAISRTDATRPHSRGRSGRGRSEGRRRAESAALALFRQVNMGTKVSKLPVLSALAQAYWVTGDTGLKQTTEQAWAGVTLEAEEIAAIVPVPEAVVEGLGHRTLERDSGRASPKRSASPSTRRYSWPRASRSWPAAIVPAAIAAGNAVEAGTSTVPEGGIVGDIDAALDLVEADGFDPTAIAAKRSLRGMLRRARDTQGQRLADLGAGTVEGLPVSLRGRWSVRRHHAGGDRRLHPRRARHPPGRDVQNPRSGRDFRRDRRHDLQPLQQDMLAMRVVMRVAFAVGNPVTRDKAPRGTLPPSRCSRT